ncbi:pentapeptide repeat-containing protein [Nocardia bovistercoris]|uniref:Pentapeptide repeat-containing protein n=1 Tax=Nocardia bovistercoris TaxID=2785916 RepID=A0A931N137_9NOCA|nr:pentapeptide repeat-containing protein [Nocardia bovistercoris]MBH0775594.1 pentapeptide repeat-containing protein [Nocardia bovistercoris]
MRPRALLIGLACAVGAAALLYVLYQLPIWLADDELGRLDTKDRLAAAATLRGQFVPVVSVVLGLAGLVYTARKLLLDRASQTVDRFNTAVTHLDSDNPVTRGGGAWALQAIMDDAPRERNRGRRLLAHFLRERTAHRSTADLPGDVEAALEVLRSQRRPERRYRAEEPLDLTGLRAPRADLHEFPLTNARLADTELTGANLRAATLDGAHLDHANLIAANLTDASLKNAHLRDARLNNATLTNADLTGADLTRATLSAADLTGTILIGANLTDAIGLTTRQLEQARTDPTTRLPSPDN